LIRCGWGRVGPLVQQAVSSLCVLVDWAPSPASVSPAALNVSRTRHAAVVALGVRVRGTLARPRARDQRLCGNRGAPDARTALPIPIWLLVRHVLRGASRENPRKYLLTGVFPFLLPDFRFGSSLSRPRILVLFQAVLVTGRVCVFVVRSSVSVTALLLVSV